MGLSAKLFSSRLTRDITYALLCNNDNVILWLLLFFYMASLFSSIVMIFDYYYFASPHASHAKCVSSHWIFGMLRFKIDASSQSGNGNKFDLSICEAIYSVFCSLFVLCGNSLKTFLRFEKFWFKEITFEYIYQMSKYFLWGMNQKFLTFLSFCILPIQCRHFLFGEMIGRLIDRLWSAFEFDTISVGLRMGRIGTRLTAWPGFHSENQSIHMLSKLYKVCAL